MLIGITLIAIQLCTAVTHHERPVKNGAKFLDVKSQGMQGFETNTTHYARVIARFFQGIQTTLMNILTFPYIVFIVSFKWDTAKQSNKLTRGTAKQSLVF